MSLSTRDNQPLLSPAAQDGNGMARLRHAGGDHPLEGGAPAAAPATEPPAARWEFARRALFRFAFVYLALYCVPFLLAFPVLFVNWWPAGLWHQASWPVVSWVAEHVFRVEVSEQLSRLGAGEVTSEHIRTFCHLVLAGAV